VGALQLLWVVSGYIAVAFTIFRYW